MFSKHRAQTRVELRTRSRGDEMNTSVDSNYGKHNFNNELGTQLMLNSLVTSSRFVRWIIWQAFPSCPYLFYDFLILHLDKLRLSTPTMSRYAIRTVRPPPSSFPRIPTPVEDGDSHLEMPSKWMSLTLFLSIFPFVIKPFFKAIWSFCSYYSPWTDRC